jgi:predicted ATPase
MRAAFAAWNGVEVDTQGDAFFAAFARAHDAVAAAADAQRRLTGGELAVRIGVHTGEPTLEEGGYYVGVDLSRAARICAAAHGGQVLLSRSTYDLVRDDVDVLDLGDHVLKDIEVPERLLQLVAAGLRERFPPLRAWAPGNLPRTRTRFFGRRRELEDIRRLLSGDAPVVTLTGPGGVGKTRLAVEAARELSGDFNDGAFFVSLAATRAADVPAALAQTLDVTEQAGESPLEALQRRLESSQVLLVLDNFESALDAAPQVAELVHGCPQLKVLATSRERLHLRAEHEYRLDPLAATDASDLFAARASAARPDLDVDAHRDDVAAICKQLDRLPLALELAAARARVLPLRTILDRLGQRLTFLTGGARDLPERQRTLAATIEWSFALLDDEEQVAFLSLAVFAGGASLDAIEGVVGPEDALELVTSLVDKSLILSRPVDDGTPRFTMLATIREFALERLAEQGHEAETRRRHAEYFRDLAERSEHDIQGRKQARLLQQLSLEHGNFRTALAWASDAGEGETLVRLAGALWRFWFVRGHLSEGQAWLERALVCDAPPGARARALHGATVLAAVSGELNEARRIAQALLDVRRELGVDEDTARALSTLANVYSDLGELDAAADLYEEAAEHAQRADARPALAGIMTNQGYLSLLREEPEAASATSREAALLFEELGFVEEQAGAWVNVASAELSLDRLTEARNALARGLDHYVAVGHADGVSYCLDIAATIAARLGDKRRAALLIGAAAAARERTGGTLPPVERRLHDATLALLDGLDAARAEGAALEPEAAVALARS